MRRRHVRLITILSTVLITQASKRNNDAHKNVSQSSKEVLSLIAPQRRAEEISVLEDCQSYLGPQRRVYRNEYTDYLLKAATEDIIERTDESVFDIAALKNLFVDSDARFITDYATYIPNYTSLPSSILQIFAKYSCKYPPGDAEDMEQFCDTESPTIENMPENAVIRLANIKNADRLKEVVANMCNKAVTEWQEVLQDVMASYIDSGLLKKKTTENNVDDPSPVASSTNNVSDSTAIAGSFSNSTGVSEPTSVANHTKEGNEKYESASEEESDENSVEIAQSTPTASPIGVDSTSRTPVNPSTGKMYLPTFLMKLDINGDSLEPESSKVDQPQLLDKTTTFLEDQFQQHFTDRHTFKHIFLNMSVQKQRNRFLRETQSTLLVAFEGVAHFKGDPPENDEVEQVIGESLASPHFLKVVKSSGNAALASVERIRVAWMEDDVASASSNTRSFKTINIILSVVAGFAALMLGSALVVYVHEYRQHLQHAKSNEHSECAVKDTDLKQPHPESIVPKPAKNVTTFPDILGNDPPSSGFSTSCLSADPSSNADPSSTDRASEEVELGVVEEATLTSSSDREKLDVESLPYGPSDSNRNPDQTRETTSIQRTSMLEEPPINCLRSPTCDEDTKELHIFTPVTSSEDDVESIHSGFEVNLDGRQKDEMQKQMESPPTEPLPQQRDTPADERRSRHFVALDEDIYTSGFELQPTQDAHIDHSMSFSTAIDVKSIESLSMQLVSEKLPRASHESRTQDDE